mmetsp:Transcript_909/g.1976  ORF Transcript_909/g.1976 Transcript_909/m.1976 type:complete len:80 (-) Transcript_909:1001-1240(-)
MRNGYIPVSVQIRIWGCSVWLPFPRLRINLAEIVRSSPGVRAERSIASETRSIKHSLHDVVAVLQNLPYFRSDFLSQCV